MHVTLGTPSYDGNFCSQYVLSLGATAGELAAQGIGFSMALAVGNPFVDLARNEIVDRFMKSDSTDLLFVDADVGWDAKTITRVLSYDEDVVAGLVPKRNAERDDEYHQNAFTGVMQPNGLMQTLEAPTAFMRIRRSALERILAASEPQTDGKPFRFFHSGTAAADWGEDIFFCRRFVAIGGSLWIDSDITFTHYGHKTWRGNFFEHATKSGLLVKS